jgi:hypothetical protein
MSFHKTLDPRAKPPQIIKDTYKSHQKLRVLDGDAGSKLLDVNDENVHEVGTVSRETILEACLAVENEKDTLELRDSLYQSILERPIYEHTDLPGR